MLKSKHHFVLITNMLLDRFQCKQQSYMQALYKYYNILSHRSDAIETTNESHSNVTIIYMFILCNENVLEFMYIIIKR